MITVGDLFLCIYTGKKLKINFLTPNNKHCQRVTWEILFLKEYNNGRRKNVYENDYDI